jgi:hypothetical protein
MWFCFFQLAFARSILRTHAVLSRLHFSYLDLLRHFVDESDDDLIFAIKGARMGTKKEGGTEEVPVVSILPCTPEMVRDVLRNSSQEKIESEVRKLTELHKKSTSRLRLHIIERVLKPGQPWELNRQPKVATDFKRLLYDPLLGKTKFFLNLSAKSFLVGELY